MDIVVPWATTTASTLMINDLLWKHPADSFAYKARTACAGCSCFFDHSIYPCHLACNSQSSSWQKVHNQYHFSTRSTPCGGSQPKTDCASFRFGSLLFTKSSVQTDLRVDSQPFYFSRDSRRRFPWTRSVSLTTTGTYLGKSCAAVATGPAGTSCIFDFSRSWSSMSKFNWTAYCEFCSWFLSNCACTSSFILSGRLVLHCPPNSCLFWLYFKQFKLVHGNFAASFELESHCNLIFSAYSYYTCRRGVCAAPISAAVYQPRFGYRLLWNCWYWVPDPMHRWNL